MVVVNWLLIILVLLLQILSAFHAMLYKRDPRAAWAWIVICLVLPPFGPILYFLLGINRVRTKAKQLKWYWPLLHSHIEDDDDDSITECIDSPTLAHFSVAPNFHHIATISESVTKRPLLCQNTVSVLHNGEQAYPEMLEMIENATSFIYLSTYIFETNASGMEFVHALHQAQKRGIEVKVLVDGIGEFYNRPRVSRELARLRVPHALFLPPKLYPVSPFLNLRNHRKMLIVDGCHGFTGGMNIGDRHLVQNIDNASRVQDIHFKLCGPVVNQMEQIFLEDWGFCTGDVDLAVSGPAQGDGDAICRTITVGPNQDLNKLSMIIVGAAAVAEERITIMTPYFIPTRELIGALQSAALRGIRVDIVLPGKNNLPFVHWSTRNMIWELLQYGVRFYYQPPPFNHSKIFLMDDFYAQIGSANLDPRSLRLNFELVVEVFDHMLARNLTDHVDAIIEQSHEITLQEVDSRPLHIRIRDSFFWLFSPYY